MKGTLICLLSLAAAFAAADQIVWDQGPGTGTIGNGDVTDDLTSFNWLDSVRFSQSTRIDTYYLYGHNLQQNDGFHVRVFSDVGGVPGGLLFDSAGAGHDNGVVGHDSTGLEVTEFAIDLAGNQESLQLNGDTTYWIGGMFSNNGAGAFIHAPQDDHCAEMIGTTFQGIQPFGEPDVPTGGPTSARAYQLGRAWTWRCSRHAETSLPVERWINVGLPVAFDYLGVLDGVQFQARTDMLADCLSLGYAGVRAAVVLYTKGNPEGCYSYFYNDGTHLSQNDRLIDNIVDSVGPSGLKLILILAYGPNNDTTGAGSWVLRNSSVRWPDVNRPNTTIVMDGMAEKFNAMMRRAASRWTSMWGRKIEDLIFEWWNEPYLQAPAGAGGAMPSGLGGSMAASGIDIPFMQMSQRILSQLNTQGCKLLAPSFQWIDPTQLGYSTASAALAIPILAANLDSLLGTYDWPARCSASNFHIYPFGRRKDEYLGAAFLGRLVRDGAQATIEVLRNTSFGKGKDVWITETGARGNWIGFGDMGRNFDTIARGDVIVALEKGLGQTDAKASVLYTLNDTPLEASGVKHGLRDTFFNTFTNSYKAVAASQGRMLSVQPRNGKLWPAQFPAPLNPKEFGNALVLFLEATNLVTSSMGKVSAWGDQSNAGNNAAQLSPPAQPSLVANVINGAFPAIRIGQSGPTQTFMTLMRLIDDITIGIKADFDIFIMGVFPSGSFALANSGSADFGVFQNPAGNDKIGWQTLLTVLPQHLYTSPNAAPAHLDAAGGCVIEVVRAGAITTFYYNGAQLFTGTTGLTCTTDNMRLNSLCDSNGTVTPQCDIGAILVFNRALGRDPNSSNESKIVLDYLFRTYNFTSGGFPINAF